MIDTSTLDITNPILKLIAELDEFKGMWAAASNLVPDRLAALRRVATIESVGSSTRIEGSKLSDREVEALLANLEIKTFVSRDEQEVAGYAAVMNTIFESFEHIPLTENTILQLHRDLLAYSEKDHRHRGHYKTSPNTVEAFDAEGRSIGVVFQTASPFDTPRLMNELVAWFTGASSDDGLHPLLAIAVFIVVFLEIHPLQDGNGRLSRALTTLLLLRAGYRYVPFSALESIIEQNKDGYYLALRRTQGTIRTARPDWQPWVVFFLQSLVKQKSRLAEKLERERIAIATLPPLSLAIMDFVKSHGRATVRELVAATGAKRGTVRDHLSRLVEQNQLTMHGAGRGVWYGMN